VKVLHLFPVHEMGGAESVLLNLVRFRRRTDVAHEALLIANEDGALGAELTKMGTPWARVPRGRMRNPWALWAACAGVREQVIARRPDVLLSNSAQSFLYGRLATVRLGLPGALYQMSVPDIRWWHNGPLDWLTPVARPDLVFAASNAIRDRVAHWSSNPVRTVYHGTGVPIADVNGVARVEHELAERGVPREAPVVLMPGRLQAWKGQRLFLQAFADVHAAHPEAHAVCLGSALFGLDPDYPQQLADDVRARGLDSHFHLVPHQSVAPWLDRAAIVVHASLTADAFPNVCIEALASKRALVTNTLAGTSEILENGHDAMVVLATDAEALSGAIRDLLDNRMRRDQMAEAGYRTYLRTCTPEHMVDAIESSLIDVVASGTGMRTKKAAKRPQAA
jgi:glycosyltransferase involved in cell wall biosynthesis